MRPFQGICFFQFFEKVSAGILGQIASAAIFQVFPDVKKAFLSIVEGFFILRQVLLVSKNHSENV